MQTKTTRNDQTAHAAARQIIDQMSTDDRASYTREGWRDGIAAMMVDDWADLDVDAVLTAVETVLAAEQ